MVTGRRLAALLLAGFLVGVPGTAGAAAPVGQVKALTLTADRARFLFSGTQLPPDAVLDPASIKVSLGGRTADADAEQPGAPLPVEGGGTRRVDRSVMIVLDTSGSMGVDGLGAAKRGAEQFLRRLPADVSAGLALAGARPGTQLVAAPATDRTALTRSIRALRPRGETELFDGIADAVDALTGADRRVVVLSDGADTDSRATLRDVRSRLSSAGITLDAVAFRTGESDDAPLRTLTAATGGRMLKSADTDSLLSAFETAAQSYRQSMWVTVRLPSGRDGDRLELVATARAGATTLRASAQVKVPAKPTVPGAPAKAAPPELDPVTGALLLPTLVVVFLAIGAIVLAVFVNVRRREDTGVAARIDRYRVHGDDMDEETSSLLRRALGLGEKVASSGDYVQRVARDLERAGMAMKPSEWLLIRAGAGAVVALVLTLVTGNPFLGVVLGGLLAWGVTRVVLSSRITRRLNTFADQLPDALQIIASSLRSGFTVAQSLDRLAEQDIDPLSTEIARAVAQTRLGVGVDEALEHTADRMECRDLRWVVMAIRIQREVGGNLADVIEQTVETMRERTHLRRHVRALSAEGRMSAYVLISLPIFVTGGMLVVRAEYLEPLYTTTLGIVLLVGAVGSVFTGWVWMSRLVKVEA